MKVLFCGDIMPGGVLCYQDEYVSDDIKSLFLNSDLRVGTLECAIGDNIAFDSRKMALPFGKNIVYAPNDSLKRIKELNFNVVTLANNHIFDLGYEGLKNTISLLDEADIKHCGAGANLKEASKPCYVNIKDKTFAFIGCCFKDLPPYVVEAATDSKPGIFQTDINGIRRVIKEAKQNADYVTVLPHWGKEYSYMPPDRCLSIARVMIKAGADAIMGSHPHIINPIIQYKDKPVYFSMGNFMFPDFCIQVPRPIYYPNTKQEVDLLPTVKNYPKTVNGPTKVVWDKPSRIGFIPIVSFSDSIEVTDYLCKMSEHNILELMPESEAIDERIKIERIGKKYANCISWITRTFKYFFVTFFIRIKNKLMRIIKG